MTEIALCKACGADVRGAWIHQRFYICCTICDGSAAPSATSKEPAIQMWNAVNKKPQPTLKELIEKRKGTPAQIENARAEIYCLEELLNGAQERLLALGVITK